MPSATNRSCMKNDTRASRNLRTSTFHFSWPAVVCGALVFVLIGILLGVALLFFRLAVAIVAGIEGCEGDIAYRYPFTLRT